MPWKKITNDLQLLIPNRLFIWSLGTIHQTDHTCFIKQISHQYHMLLVFPFHLWFFSPSLLHTRSPPHRPQLLVSSEPSFFSHHIIFSQGQLIHAFLMVSNNINKKMSPPSYRCSSALSKWQHYLHAGVAKNLGTILRYRNLSLHSPSLPIIHPLTNNTHFTS